MTHDAMSQDLAAQPVATAATSPGATAPGQPTRGSALQARRWLLVVSPVLAGLFAVLGAAADPAVGADGEVLWKAYAANPEPLQFKSLGFHWSYAFWLLPPLMIAPLVRGRGVWIANLAGLLGFVGISTLPGLLIVDFIESSIGQVGGVEMNAAVAKVADEMWGLQAIVTPGLIGFVLAPPLAALAAWRGGIVRWWGPAAVLAGFAAFTLSNINVWGTLLTTVFFSVYAYELARGTRPRAADANATPLQ